MGLVTIVLVLVFYPYVTFRGERYSLEARAETVGNALGDARRDLDEGAALLDEYRHELMPAASERISAVRPDELRTAAAEHARALAGIRRAVADDPAFEAWLATAKAGAAPPSELRRKHPALRQGGGKPCFWLGGEAWRRCALGQALDAAHGDAARPFGRGRVSHLRNELFGPLADALSVLKESFAAFLQGNRPAWQLDAPTVVAALSERHREFLALGAHDWTAPLAFSGPPVEQARQFAELYRFLLEVHERFLYEARNALDERVRDLENEKSGIDSELDIVVAKLADMKGLQDIQTPFGTLPVGLNELVLLFPALVAAAFTLTASLFVESLELRREYHHLTRLADPDGAVLPDRRIALIAPVWIDPLQPAGYRVYRALILALPAAAFVGSIMLLVHNQLLFGPFMQEARLNEVAYLVLYAGGALAVLEGSRRVARALRGYVVEVP